MDGRTLCASRWACSGRHCTNYLAGDRSRTALDSRSQPSSDVRGAVQLSRHRLLSRQPMILHCSIKWPQERDQLHRVAKLIVRYSMHILFTVYNRGGPCSGAYLIKRRGGVPGMPGPAFMGSICAPLDTASRYLIIQACLINRLTPPCPAPLSCHCLLQSMSSTFEK